ncbi:MAG TPA: hypothetical protein VN372_01050 [Methanospirillum sp.]|nr:hypothetical protein [Methanospirillum sp.]
MPKAKAKSQASVSLRMPAELKDALEQYVTSHEHSSMSEAIVDILIEKLNPLIPGLCRACNYQNPVDAKFCCQCGKQIMVHH